MEVAGIRPVAGSVLPISRFVALVPAEMMAYIADPCIGAPMRRV
jgi:hypothetical protein